MRFEPFIAFSMQVQHIQSVVLRFLQVDTSLTDRIIR
jgi:hypothetical protein